MSEPITQLIGEGETAVQQDPQGNWAIVQKGEGQVMRVKTPNGIIEQPLAQTIPTSTIPTSVVPTPNPESNVPLAHQVPTQPGIVKTMEYVAAGEAAVGIAAAGATLLEDLFKNK